MLSILSLNVNGIRSFAKSLDKNFNDWLLAMKYDIFCFQEVKGSKESLRQFHTLKDFVTFSSFHHKNGRHGVSTVVKKEILINKSEEVVKGRILKTFHGNFIIYNVYLPYCSVNDENIDVMKVYEKFQNELESDSSNNLKIICGDLNAVYSIYDHYLYFNEYEKLVIPDKWTDKISYNIDLFKTDNLEISDVKNNSNKLFSTKFYNKLVEISENCKTVEKIKPKATELPLYFLSVKSLEEFFFNSPQRQWLKKLMEKSVDVFRVINKNLHKYTCWDVKLNLRECNWGSRIDYIILYNCKSDEIVVDSQILSEIYGSDHAPVTVKLNIEVIKTKEKIKNNLFDYFTVKQIKK